MKENIQFRLIKSSDLENIDLIANWYLMQWNIPIEKTVPKIQNLSIKDHEFHVLMSIDGRPVATGGLHTHVGLLDKEPRFKIYKNWLALIYTDPENRNKGYGMKICQFIQNHSKDLGLKKLFLFTNSAEHLYSQLGWMSIERILLNGKDTVVMSLELL